MIAIRNAFDLKLKVKHGTIVARCIVANSGDKYTLYADEFPYPSITLDGFELVEIVGNKQALAIDKMRPGDYVIAWGRTIKEITPLAGGDFHIVFDDMEIDSYGKSDLLVWCHPVENGEYTLIWETR